MRRLLLVWVCLPFLLLACQSPGGPKLGVDEQLNVTVSATSYDFGSLQVGQTSGVYTVDVGPYGYTADTVTAVSASCPDFVIDAPGLPADVYRTCEQCPCATASCLPALVCCYSDFVSYSFNTYFRPTVGGATSCAVTIYTGSGSNKVVTLTGTGTLPPVQIDVQPTSVAFGDVRRTTDSSPFDLSVRNLGGATMTVSSVSISSGFTILSGPTGAYQVGAGGMQAYSIACHPTTTGPLSGAFTVNSDDPSRPTVSIPLSCNGIDSALAITPSPAQIPTTRVGEPAAASIVLQNSGNANMNLEGVTVAGTNIAMTSSPALGSIGPGGTRNVDIAFSATAAGSESATMTVTFDGGQMRTSQITARALATSMSVTPDGDVDFGPVCAGQTRSQSFTIIANAEGPFQVSSLTGAAAPFTVSSGALPFTVQGNAANKLMFDVTAAPTDAGVATSTLALTTDIPGSSPRMINLSVSGIAAGITPDPAAVDFGPNTINTTTIGQSVHLSNCSAGATTFMRARIEGPDASEFAIVAQPDSSTIQPTMFATWLVVFQGREIGTKTATFLVDYDGGTAMIPLTGDAVGDTPPPTTPETPAEISYYTCSTGGSGSQGFVWTFAVLGFVLWRRRRTRC